MQRLSERNLTSNEEKCVIAAREVEFLGYSVSAQGITPLKSNVEAIQQVTQPSNVTELASFLGATHYYLRFIPSYAEVTTPLRKLLKQGEWNWSKECQAAFEKLKELVTSAPTLAHFDIDMPIYVTCDASGNALGAVLSPIQDSMERPVAFTSRALSEAEKKYGVEEREALACMWACERWHIYLYGRNFILCTDHQTLTTLLSANGSGHRPLRLYEWTDKLYRYDFAVEYRPGRYNQVADFLSRVKLPEDHSTSRKPAVDQFENSEMIQMLVTVSDKTVSQVELERESEEGEGLQDVVKYVQEGWPEKSPYPVLTPYFTIQYELSVSGTTGKCLARGQRLFALHYLLR